jgi:hypothetical protein
MGAVSKERPEPPSPRSKSAASKDAKAADGRWKMPPLPLLQPWEISVIDPPCSRQPLNPPQKCLGLLLKGMSRAFRWPRQNFEVRPITCMFAGVSKFTRVRLCRKSTTWEFDQWSNLVGTRVAGRKYHAWWAPRISS